MNGMRDAQSSKVRGLCRLRRKKNNFGTHELYLSHSLSTFLAIIIKPLQLSPLSSQLIMLP